MISFVQWLGSFSAGVWLSAQTVDILKKVNEWEPAAKIPDQQDSAVIDETEFEGSEQFLGSEQISNVLQHIMNGERNYGRVYLDSKHNNTAKGQQYALGSESLNRLLEDMTNAESVNSRPLSFEPAMDI